MCCNGAGENTLGFTHSDCCRPNYAYCLSCICGRVSHPSKLATRPGSGSSCFRTFGSRMVRLTATVHA